MLNKPTGPGKIATSSTPEGLQISGIVALLFNFGFDDATVKLEHRAVAGRSCDTQPHHIGHAGLPARHREPGRATGTITSQLSKRRWRPLKVFLHATKESLQTAIVASFTGAGSLDVVPGGR